MFKSLIACLLSLFVVAAGLVCPQASGEQPSPEQLEFFEKRVRPLLVAHCYECHSAQSPKLQAELRLDHLQGVLVGGDSGPAIVPGDAQESLFIQAIRYESYEMPPQGKLAQDEIDVLVQWVNSGAPWPDEPPPQVAAPAASFDIDQRKAAHWAWQGIQAAPPPAVQKTDWPATAIDHFILHDLEAAGLSPAAPVDRRSLIRRLHFDLTGLPPSPQQVQSFLSDQSPVALERLVDSLLLSPHFGERWGRHWLDLVRYAESRGHEFDNDAPNAFQYRDYVIRALNADIPYDQFVREHLAGDLLSSPRLNPQLGFNESILGTGFWFLGEWVHSPVDIRKDETDRFDNMIDVMSKTFLGLTVACARCHDHKFDAISTADYYALSGFLQSSDYRQVRFDSVEHNRQLAEQLASLDHTYRRRIMKLLAAERNHGRSAAANQLVALQSGTAAVEPEAKQPAEAIDEQLILVDYRSLSGADYMQDGFLFGPAPRQPGELFITHTRQGPQLQVARSHAATTDPFWFGLKSHSDSVVQQKDRLSTLAMSGRTLRTPSFTLGAAEVACWVRGSGHIIACVDSHRLVAGPLHGETIVKIRPGEDWQWVRLSLARYIGHRLHLEFVPEENAPLEVSLIVQGGSPQQLTQLQQRQQALAGPSDELAQWIDELLSAPAEHAPAVAEEIRRCVTRWAEQRAALRERIRTESRLAMAISDGSSEHDRILIRGNASHPGPVVPRRFLSALDGPEPLRIRSRSGRLELAERVNDPSNPLPHRVIVNRIWHSLMGRGIVPTTDDFGVLGQLPTHPELLDHLAKRFLQDGRSIKRMIRYIVLSQTYQMSSQVDPAAARQDPGNLLWHHHLPRRLQGEAIRDALLAISGRLDAGLHGAAVPIHLTAFMQGRGRPPSSGPADGDGRRSVYIAVRRNFLSPFMLAFDTPAPFSTMGRRNVSNVPAQALILLNDPFVVSQARLWAERVLAEPQLRDPVDNMRARVTGMYRSAFARPPSDAELAAAIDFLHPSVQHPAGIERDELSRWSDFAHALINTKEFIYLR